MELNCMWAVKVLWSFAPISQPAYITAKLCCVSGDFIGENNNGFHRTSFHTVDF